MALDRTWYNTLVDDDGSNEVGSLIDKADIDALMDAIDAALAVEAAARAAAVAATQSVGTWTPTDASGAGLALTASGTYVRTGSLLCAACDVLYPATADGAQAVIAGLPVAAYGSVYAGAFVSYCNVGFPVMIQIAPGSVGLTVFNATSGAAVTNAQMTGKILRAVAVYRTV